MNHKIAVLLLAVLVVALPAGCERILLISDSADIETTHSQFLNMLKNSHEVEVAFSFGKNKISLRNYDRFNYQHVIVMSLSTAGTSPLT